MKKFISLFMALIMIVIPLSSTITAYADRGGIGDTDSFDPLSNEYIIGANASQFDFFENYASVASLKKWATNDYFRPNKDLNDVYAKKLGITSNSLSEYQKVAKIYNYLAKTWRSYGKATTESSSAMIFRKAHCEVFSEVFSELCEKANVESWIVGTAGHAWNIVKVDGKYYQCDAMQNRELLTNLQDVITANASYYMDVKNLDGSIIYAGDAPNNGLEQWADKYGNISTTDYPIPEGTGTLDMPKTTVKATSEGVVVNWEPVNGADWYEVYYTPVQGTVTELTETTMDFTTNKMSTTVYDGELAYYITTPVGKPFPFKSAANAFVANSNIVHSIDRNEKGNYQFFIPGDMLTEYGIAVVVVAKSVDGKMSANPSDAEAMAKAISSEYTVDAYKATSVQTGKTVSNPTAAKFNEGNFVVNGNYTSSTTHNYAKVATPIKNGDYNQGAEVYECTDCLQRKMVYTPALKGSLADAKPKNTSISSLSAVINGFKVNWSKVSDTTGYQIQYGTKSDFSNAATVYGGAVNTTSKTITGRAAGTKYYVRVRTYRNINGEYVYGDWSSAKSVTTPAKPKNTSVSSVTSVVNGFKVNWSKVSDTTGYQIQYSTRSDFKNAATVYGGATNTTSKTITGRAAGTKYYVRVRTYKNINGEYLWGNWTSAKTVTTKIQTANAKSVSAVSKGFKVTWDKIGGITGYQIQYSTRSDFKNAATVYAGNATATTKTITGRAKNTKYYVRVRAYKNNNGSYVYGSWSSAKTVTTKK